MTNGRRMWFAPAKRQGLWSKVWLAATLPGSFFRFCRASVLLRPISIGSSGFAIRPSGCANRMGVTTAGRRARQRSPPSISRVRCRCGMRKRTGDLRCEVPGTAQRQVSTTAASPDKTAISWQRPLSIFVRSSASWRGSRFPRRLPAPRMSKRTLPLETLDRLIRAGKIRSTKDIRSLIYMSMSGVNIGPMCRSSHRIR